VEGTRVMPDESIAITSIASMKDALAELDKAFRGDAIWWRGHSDAIWKLRPGVFRDRNRVPGSSYDELALIGNFRPRAVGMLGDQPRPTSEVEWLFLAQHYGLPTRMLDWTENLIVALYFAVSEKPCNVCRTEKDGCIWAASPTILNKKNSNPGDSKNAQNGIVSISEPTVQAMALRAFGFGDGEILGRFPQLDPGNIGKPNLPGVLALESVEMGKRIVAQSGRFTIHGCNTAVENLDGHEKYLRKFIIPADKKEEIRKLLKWIGIRRWNLFPDLNSLAAGLKDDSEFMSTD
jgi:hypothetical protein